MNKYLETTDWLVDEPVKLIVDNITSSSQSKTILGPLRGSGKSCVIDDIYLAGIKSSNKAIKMDFNQMSLNIKMLNEELLIHYYELLISKNILSYIKRNYNKRYFEYEKIVIDCLIELNKYLDNFYNRNYKEIYPFQTGELVLELISKIKNDLNADSVALLIDRFDWTTIKTKKIQNVLSRYFELFDRIVITSDDEEILIEKRKEDLTKKGFNIVEVDYGKNIDIIKEIVEKRNFSNKLIFPEITDEIYEYVISQANGNIDLIIKILNSLNSSYRYHGANFDILKETKEICREKTDYIKMLSKMGQTPKLYL